MAVIFLLIVNAALSLAFAYGAIYFLRYRKKFQDAQNGFGAAASEKHPRLYAWMKFLLPVVIAGFIFNAIFASFSFIEGVVRLVISH